MTKKLLDVYNKEDGSLLASYYLEKISRCSECGADNVPILDSMRCLDCQCFMAWSDPETNLLPVRR